MEVRPEGSWYLLRTAFIVSFGLLAEGKASCSSLKTFCKFFLGMKKLASPATQRSSPLKREPVIPRQKPMLFLSLARVQQEQISVKKPRRASGMANMVFSVAILNEAIEVIPNPPPMTIPSQTAICQALSCEMRQSVVNSYLKKVSLSSTVASLEKRSFTSPPAQKALPPAPSNQTALPLSMVAISVLSALIISKLSELSALGLFNTTLTSVSCSWKSMLPTVLVENLNALDLAKTLHGESTNLSICDIIFKRLYHPVIQERQTLKYLTVYLHITVTSPPQNKQSQSHEYQWAAAKFLILFGLNRFKFRYNTSLNMSVQALHNILEEFAAQRRYREQRRNEFLRRFENVRQSLGIEQPRHHQHSKHGHENSRISHGQNTSHPQEHAARQVPQPIPAEHERSQPPRSQQQPLPQAPAAADATLEEQELLNQHKQLTRAMQELQAKSEQQLGNFRAALENAKTKYVSEIAKLVENSNSSKQQLESKMVKLKQQIQSALRKNQEIETVNASIKSQLSNKPQGEERGSLEYLNEIRKQYDEKIAAFKSVFDASNEKIEALEKEFNEEEFIENTINNEELLKSIEENASKAEEATKILEDYKTLREGKEEILAERKDAYNQGSMQMKEKEIEKMCELEQKMKSIMDRLGQEKKIYVQENSRMAKELMEIKELLMATVGQSRNE